MPRLPTRHRALALLAVASSALAVGGCGGADRDVPDRDVPSDAIARVGDQVIPRSSFEHWLKATAGAQASGQRAAAPVLDPPNFSRCIAAKRRERWPEGLSKPGPAELKARCRQQYERRKDRVVEFLVSAAWTQQEAARRGIKVADAEIDRRLENQKQQAFESEKAYREYLASSGVREEDIRFSFRIEALRDKIDEQVGAGAGQVPDEEVADFYAKNKARFVQPERRDVEVVLTEDKATARRALSEIRRGNSFAKTAKRYSIDATSKDRGGKLRDVVRGSQLGRPLEDAIFGARRGELVGPVKTASGYYVLRVTGVTPGSRPSLADKAGAIRNVLQGQRRQKALAAFSQELNERYRTKTTCAEGFVVNDFCGNAPKEEPPGSAAPTGEARGSDK